MGRFVLVVAVSLVGCSHPNSAPSLPEVRVALVRDVSTLPVRLAQVLGYAQQEGIRLSISDTPGVSKAMEALLGRSVDVAASGLSQAIQVAAEGRTVRCFINYYTRPTLTLVVAPAMTGKIRHIRDLKGRQVGIASPGSPTHQFLNRVLVLNGLRPDDVSTVSVGTAAPSVAALGHGKVDAASLAGAAIHMFERKYPNTMILAETRTAEGAQTVFGSAVFPNTGLSAQDDWLKTNAGAARSLVRALKRAMNWMRNHAAEEIRGQMPEGLRMEDIEADLMAIRHAQHILSPDGAIPPEAPELVRKWLAASSEKVRAARIDLAKTYTNEFVEAGNEADCADHP